MVTLTELVRAHQSAILNGNFDGFYAGVATRDLTLTTGDFVEAQRLLVSISPRDMIDVNTGIVSAYRSAYTGSSAWDAAYENLRAVLREAKISPGLPSESQSSVVLLD